jgi:hypothetical protein
VKTNLDDMKDLAHQAKLEFRKESKPTTLTDKMKNVGILGEQVGIEVKKQTRDAALKVQKSDTKKAIDGALIKTGDTAVDTKDSLIDAVAPPTDEEIARREQKKEIVRAERDEEIEKERKRQELVDNVKAKSHAVSQTVVHGAQAVGEIVKTAASNAEVALGKAALVAKDKLDEYTDDAPPVKTKTAISKKGVDISSVENPRNEELLKKEARAVELEKAQEPTLLEKAKVSLSKTADSVKDAYEEATTDPKPAVFVAKTSSSGIDISHVENPNNAILAAREEERLAAERAAVHEREKTIVEGHVKEEAHSLKEKLEALGDSLLKASHKLGDDLSAKYGELTHKEGDAIHGTAEHPATSVRGVDVTGIENARNEELGEEIRAKQLGLDAPNKPKDDLIKKTLDAGVVVQEKGRVVEEKTTHAANAVKYQAKIAAAEADIKATEIKQAAAFKQQQLSEKATELKEKAVELKDQTVEKAVELKEKAIDLKDQAAVKAHDASLKAQDLTAQATDKMADLKLAAGEKLHETKEKLSSSAPTESHEKPTLIRVPAVDALPVQSPITPSMQQPLVLNIKSKQ